MKYEYDVIVIGGGAAGLTASKTAQGLGNKVALIEKTDRLGGECTWTGCIPSKTLIKVAEVAWHTKKLDQYGLTSNQLELSTDNVMEYVRNIIKDDYQSHTPEKIREDGIDILFGDVHFVDDHMIKLEEKTITAHKFIICTGSSPFIPEIQGLDSVAYLTNQNLFSLDQLPKSMIILGGGPIGCEMASALNRLGVQATIIEMNDRILPREDQELVAMLSEQMRAEGVEIKTGLKVVEVIKSQDGVEVVCEPSRSVTLREPSDFANASTDMQGEGLGMVRFSAERILVAVGRTANTAGMNLEIMGIEFDKRGIKTDATMRTTAPNIWAAGDVVGPYLFSHMAWYQAMIAARNTTIPFFKKKVSYDNVIWVTFTAPELARAGLLEHEAREQYGDTIHVIRMPYGEIDRAVTDRTTNGLGKFICDKRGRLLGIHILGARAGDIIHEAQVIKALGKPFKSLFGVIHAYPTYSELIWKSAKKAYIHGLERSFFGKLGKKLLKK